jgi:Tol biopolymer transport system component
VSVVIEKQGYRTEKLSIAANVAKPIAAKLVPAQKEVFVSKESGKYDLYKMDLDGQNKKVLLPGTGLETPALNVLVDPTGKRAALVSTRDDKRNKDGYLLSALTLVDIESGESEVIEHAEQITLIGWSGTTLIYQQAVAGVSAANANRNKITSYEYTNSKRIQLANANYFSGTVLTGDKLYYVVSSTDPSVQGSFVRINVDATNKKALYSGEVWQLYRVDYKTLKFQTPDKWYEYKLGNAAVAVSTPPASFMSRKYLNSPDGKTSVWVDNRDASGALIAYSVADGKERQVTMQRGLAEAMRWVNDQVVVYRTVTSNEVAEYAMSLSGGDAHRLSTVSAMY